ncbi:hypothetical protein [Bartonella krasnovii]|nr:hypothetical protein [Bartonella krasnovii]
MGEASKGACRGNREKGGRVVREGGKIGAQLLDFWGWRKWKR